MLQLLQYLGNGKTTLVEAPAPTPRRGSLLIRTEASVVSAGTERMLVDFGRAGVIGKIRKQPERVREVWSKVRSNGLLPTIRAIRSKLAQPIPLGYCNVGIVEHSGADGFAKGDRVISRSSHAEIVSADSRLCARVPEGISAGHAAFTPLAAIALQGIHLLQAAPGSKVVVVGLGLIGQLAVRLLVAKGCQVMGLDPSPARREMAAKHGAVLPMQDDPLAAVLAWTSGKGVDAVLITASTLSHAPVSQAARSCGKRGRVVLVGVVGLNLNRADFYRNEVSFQVSCSYGERDHTGPGSVRANFDEVLSHMASGALKVDDLVTQRFTFAHAPAAYDRLTADKSALGLVLDYDGKASLATEVAAAAHTANLPAFTLVGAGNFATRTLLPALASQGRRPSLIISNQGYQAVLASQQFGPALSSTDESTAFAPASPPVVFLCTRHDVHPRQARAAMAANKSAWVEKPLALGLDDLESVANAARVSKGVLMVGFNRRFAPATTKLKAALAGHPKPKKIQITVSAGRLDSDHWTLDPAAGGGRIVGEACHFVDLSRALVGRPLRSIRCTRRDTDGQDGGCFELTFADGSTSVIDYRTDLPPEVPKEQVSISGQGFTAVIHNWARLTSSGLGVSLGWPWSKAPKKGHPEALQAFLAAAQGQAPAPIPLEEILEVSRASIRMQAMAEGESVEL